MTQLSQLSRLQRRSISEPSPRRSRGYSLMEMMLVLTIMGVLIAMCAPTYQQAMEQARADVAAANLRAIWSAERLYWLTNQHVFHELERAAIHSACSTRHSFRAATCIRTRSFRRIARRFKPGRRVPVARSGAAS